MDYYKNLEIYEAMWQEAVDLGIFPLKNMYDGLENDIRVAAILNGMPVTNIPVNVLADV